MDFKIVSKGKDIIFTIGGTLTFADTNELKHQLAEIERLAPDNVTFDFKDLTFIDSMGMGLLIAAHDAGEKGGYHTSITNASGSVEKILRNASFDKLFGMA